MVDNKTDYELMSKLKMVSKQLCCSCEGRLRSYGLTLSEFSVLETIYHTDEIAVQELAKKVQLKSGSITHVMAKLTKKELLLKKQSKNDQRYFYVTLTDKGFELVKKIYPQHINHINMLFENISEEDKIIAIKVLSNLTHRIDDCDLQIR